MLWLDRTHQELYDFMWHNAMRVDRWFGSDREEADYKTIYGSIAPAVLWERHDGTQVPLRFNVYLPLPRMNERFHAFLARFDPSEYITEEEQPSGAFRRQYGPVREDQTILGIGYRQPERQGSRWEAGAGMRVTIPPDPYIKGSWVFERGASERGLFTQRETAFWQSSQGVGVTNRTDVERIFGGRWLARWTGSATFTTRSQGVIGWSAIDLMRGFAERRALAAELEIDGQTDAPVPLHNFGAKVAWRQGILRRWLVLELRASLGWPKDRPGQQRRISPGVGVGIEMLFGTDRFLARPVTF